MACFERSEQGVLAFVENKDLVSITCSEKNIGPGILQGEVPQEVESAFEKCSADMGVQELALLAATLDELVHQEVLQQVKAVFKAKKLPMFGHIDDQQLQKVLEQVHSLDWTA